MTTKGTKEAVPFGPTPADEWACPETRDVTLPSGNCAVMRKPNPFFLARTGQVPKSVEKAAGAQAEGFAGLDIMGRIEAASLIADFLVASAFVVPKVTMQRTKGCVYVGDLTSEDKAFVMELFDIDLS